MQITIKKISLTTRFLKLINEVDHIKKAHLLPILKKIIPLCSNIGILILYRIFLVQILASFDATYAKAASHILVVLGLLAFPYYFSTGTALQIKRKIAQKHDKKQILNTIYVALSLNFTLSLITSFFFYYYTEDALRLLNQPEDIILPTIHFTKNYTKALVLYSLIHCFQHILIGLNRLSHSSVMNIVSHGIHLSFVWIYFIYLQSFQQIDCTILNYSWYQPLILSGSLVLLLGYIYSRNFFNKHITIQLNWKEFQADLSKIFKISFPSAIQNIHGTIVHLSHVVLIGITAPHLLTIYQIFLKNNLISFVLMFGTVQAFGLENISSVMNKNLKSYLKSIKNFFIIYSILSFFIFIIFYIFLIHQLNNLTQDNSIYYDVVIGFFIMGFSFYLVCIRNGLISTLINMKDTVIPPFISTCLSLGLGMPLSLYLGSTKPILIGISIGVITHYTVAIFYLFRRMKRLWNTGNNKIIIY